MKLIGNDSNIILEQECIINMRKSKYTKKNGDEKIYKIYNTVFPKFLVNMFKEESQFVYFYEMNGKVYLTSEKPSSLIHHEKRKITSQKDSYRIALPKEILPVCDDDKDFLYKVYMNKFDYVSGKKGLVEVSVLSEV
ncbi:hypothetical protein [Methanosphaera cuniculi]|uniref:hypothetical protein n=1 Tax=Methanosphaera cuniculi TaxID=1077256 RepID=UPI0026EA96DD|nr:hypothetical protein [Methanosphaera cuniculi]